MKSDRELILMPSQPWSSIENFLPGTHIINFGDGFWLVVPLYCAETELQWTSLFKPVSISSADLVQGHGSDVELETAALQKWLAANPVSFAVSLQGGNSLVAYPTRSVSKCRSLFSLCRDMGTALSSPTPPAVSVSVGHSPDTVEMQGGNSVVVYPYPQCQ